ncbi:prepilin-type N-terminal cleavage/methylation domain-containing protein [Salipaludibacillus sp. CUR1]|uniref:competence type IV pilus minor pilin ComGD n=1 Tax=Salipaludibacillus sp. CUR1 TaxID=2820003 RepID=UPI001E5D5E37|nr:prepilin-type N-terminal cleavage/methylation domain-containing protein [Salipaludibacillus sp. CUR1]
MSVNEEAERSSKGYSYIELMITLLVLSIVLMISIPSFQTSAEKMEYRHFLKDLEQDLYYYQMYAISNGRSVRVIFSASKPSYVVLEGVKVIHEREGPQGVEFVPGTLALNELRFLPSGGVQKSGTIRISHGEERCWLVFHFLRGRFYFD